MKYLATAARIINACSVLNLLLLVCFIVIPSKSLSISDSHNPIIFDAEDAVLFEDAEVRTENQGYTGSGYLDFRKQNGYIKWEVEIEDSALYDIVIRYASMVDRPCDLYLDELEIPFDFSSSGGWEDWSTEARLVHLQKGYHVLMLVASRSAGPNIDLLSLVLYNGHQANNNNNDDADHANSEYPSIDNVDGEYVVPAPPIINYAKAVIMNNNQIMDAGIFTFSPNGKYQFGLDSSTGNLVLLEDGKIIWNAGIEGGDKLQLQGDGNLIVRDSYNNNTALWTSGSNGVKDTQLVIDDGGRVAVTQYYENPKWLAGKPRGVYKGPSSPDLQFPIRGAFYYAWYKETWTVNGEYAHSEPTLSWYRSDDPDVVEKHIEALDYAHVNLSIISWWGQASTNEAARVTQLLDKTLEMNSNLKWGIYYEDEKDHNYSAETIRADLDYLKANYAWHPTFGHKGGKPIIFVYNEGGTCEIATRWKEANSDNGWYVVLKVFPGFLNCDDQPDSWHEYSPAIAITEHQPWSTAISPEFWRADKLTPWLPRVSWDDFRTNVQKMVDNGDDWQLLTTFNEHGEGTAMESCKGWESASGFGHYLDILHYIY